jgi:hypothetical protein
MQLKVFSSCILSYSYMLKPVTLFRQGSEKLNTVLFPTIADQLKKLNHIRNPRQIDSGRLYEDHSGE